MSDLLRPYQETAISKAREAFRYSKRVFLCLPTGAGKTVIFCRIARNAIEKGRTVWIVVPRDNLIWQTSEKLLLNGMQHGIIAPGYTESSLFHIHIVSKDTWTRRKEKIKFPPQFVIVDEGHLATSRYEEMISYYPDSYFLFVSATPERLDGKTLVNLAPKSSLITGPSIGELISQQYLSPMQYFCPPVSGIENLKKTANDIDADQFAEWMAEKKVYGKTIEHYNKYGKDKQSIIYCRNVSSAKLTADKFCEAGYKIESVDGTMTKRSVRSIIKAVKDKELDGVTSCDLITYGLDVPNVSLIVLLRHTLSRPLLFQMIGRGLRYEPNKICIILDHVGNARRHFPNGLPWNKIDWQYEGKLSSGEKREKQENLKFCPYIEFMPCTRPSCMGCKYNTENKPIDDFEEIDGELVPIVGEVKIKDRTNSEKIYYNSMIFDLKNQIYKENGEIDDNSVSELVKIAKQTDRKPIWVYFFAKDLSNDSKEDRKFHVIDDVLLESIRKAAEYKDGWQKHAKKIILGENFT